MIHRLGITLTVMRGDCPDSLAALEYARQVVRCLEDIPPSPESMRSLLDAQDDDLPDGLGQLLKQSLGNQAETVGRCAVAKLLVIRFDVRFPQEGYIHDGGNREISHLLKALKEGYAHQISDIRYLWAREQVSSDHPHYHVILLVNGSLMQNPYGLLHKANEIWNRILGGVFPGLIEFCDSRCLGQRETGSIMIRRPSSVAEGETLVRQQQIYDEKLQEALGRASYLAKTFSKGNTPYRVREFGCSQI